MNVIIKVKPLKYFKKKLLLSNILVQDKGIKSFGKILKCWSSGSKLGIFPLYSSGLWKGQKLSFKEKDNCEGKNRLELFKLLHLVVGGWHDPQAAVRNETGQWQITTTFAPFLPQTFHTACLTPSALRSTAANLHQTIHPSSLEDSNSFPAGECSFPPKYTAEFAAASLSMAFPPSKPTQPFTKAEMLLYDSAPGCISLFKHPPRSDGQPL